MTCVWLLYLSLHCQNPVVQNGQTGAWPVASAYARWSCAHGDTAWCGPSDVVLTQKSACSTASARQWLTE